VLVACKPEGVDRVLANARVARPLPAPRAREEDACFRVCYGTYATSGGAAVNLPRRSQQGQIGAVEIVKVLP
jgi:hypothetical protein